MINIMVSALSAMACTGSLVAYFRETRRTARSTDDSSSSLLRTTYLFELVGDNPTISASAVTDTIPDCQQPLTSKDTMRIEELESYASVTGMQRRQRFFDSSTGENRTNATRLATLTGSAVSQRDRQVLLCFVFLEAVSSTMECLSWACVTASPEFSGPTFVLLIEVASTPRCNPLVRCIRLVLVERCAHHSHRSRRASAYDAFFLASKRLSVDRAL